VVDWDFLITGGVIVSLVLIVWSKVNHQIIKETILDIKDILQGGGEEIQERTEEVVMYE
jgi:hypothetical protein